MQSACSMDAVELSPPSGEPPSTSGWTTALNSQTWALSDQCRMKGHPHHLHQTRLTFHSAGSPPPPTPPTGRHNTNPHTHNNRTHKRVTLTGDSPADSSGRS